MRLHSLLVTAAICLIAATAFSAVGDSIVSYQGRLTNSTDNPVADGFYAATFSLWTASSGGTRIWTENQDVQCAKGLFSVDLGKMNQILDSLTKYGSQPLYLQITVNGTELLPRQRLGVAARAASAASTKGVGGLPATLARCELSASDTGAVSAIGQDVDGDGLPDVGIEASSKLPRSVLKQYFQRGDKPTQSQIADSLDELGARMAINTKGTGAAGRSSSVTLSTTESSADIAINTKGAGTNGRSVSSSTDTTTAEQIVAGDLDGDGLLDRQVWQKVDNSEASIQALADLNHDGKPDVVCSSSASQTRSELKGHFETGDIPTQSQFSTLLDSKVASSGLEITNPGQWSSSSSLLCTDDSTVHEISFTSPPGPLGTPALMKAKEKANRTKCSNNLRCVATNGAATESDISCDSASARMLLSGATSLSGSSGSSSVSVSPDSVIHVVQVGTAMEWSIHRAEHGKGGISRVSQHHGTTRDVAIGEVCDDGNARTTWSNTDNSTGTGSSITIQASTDGISHPIEVSGGAYCDGANWVNASDANLKENFQPVDGEQLLEKIAQLPVSEWNYKSQTDAQKHIGPTAQDFQKVFGVGSDGKSISTIDPSGIALAAIKQLTKENEDLKAQIAELKKMVEELAQKK